MAEATTHLLRVGFDDVQGYLEGGIDAWETSGCELTSLDTTSVHQLGRDIKQSPGSVTVLDVRTEKEWSSGHIDGAIHIHGGQLQERFADVPRDKPVAVICGNGYRGSIAASFLRRKGYEAVANVMGGMSAWKAAGLPSPTGKHAPHHLGSRSHTARRPQGRLLLERRRGSPPADRWRGLPSRAGHHDAAIVNRDQAGWLA